MKLVDFHSQDVELDTRNGPEVIFREAKRRQRRRRLVVATALVLAVAALAVVASVLPSGTGAAPQRKTTSPSAHFPPAGALRWQRVVTASAPSPRNSAPATYDQATGQLVLI